MSGKQVNTLVGNLGTEEIQTYIAQLEAAKSTSNGIFNTASLQGYSNAIQGLEAKQAALLLSTQGLTNAQIAETLAVNESNVANNYQAMADAGILKNKQKLTVAQVQENLQTVLGAEADTSAAMASLGLSTSIKEQKDKTVKLTAAKLQEAVATNVLTEAQAQEFAMRTGVTLSMQKQAASTLPKWIATLQAGTKAIWEQVAATAAWLVTTPQGWATLAVGAIALVNFGIKQYRESITKAAEESKEAINEITDSYKKLSSTVSDIKKRYAELAQGVNQFTGENKSLSNDDYAEFLDLSNQLAELFPSLSKRYDKNGNAILGLSGNVDTIVDSLTNLVEIEKQLSNQKIIDELPNVLKGYNQNRSDIESEIKSLEEWQHDLEVAYKSLQDINKVYETGPLNNSSEYLETIHVLSKLGIKYEIIDYEEGLGIEHEIIDNEKRLGTIALENYADSLDKISKSLKTVPLDISNLNSKIKSENAKFNKYLSTWLFEDWSYVSLDSELQNVIQEILFNTDWLSEAKSQGINTKKWDEVSEWIEKNYISAIANIDDDKVKSALIDLYSIPTDDQSLSEYVEQFKSALETIQTYCEKNGIKISIGISDNSYVDTYNRLQNSIRQITDDHGITDREEYAYLMNEIDFQSFTQAQVELWLKATRGAENAAQAVEMYEAALEKEKEEATHLSTILTNSADTLDKFQSSVKSAADAYATLLSGNYSSSELLDSIQAINKAVTDMGGSLDWDFINSQSYMDPLELLGDAIEHISEKYAKSILSGAGIDENNKFYQTLADIIKQTYEVEARFTGMNAQLDRLQSSYQTLTGILESYNETGYINLDNLQSLLTADENLIAMLEVENGKLTINQEAYENLVAVQLLEF